MALIGNIDELENRLNSEKGNIEYIRGYYYDLKQIPLQQQVLHFGDKQFFKSLTNDALNFFSTSRCIYAYETLLWLKKVIMVKDEKIYFYNDEFNYWEKLKTKTEAVNKVRDYLESVYDIKFSTLEMRGITVNPKIKSLINNICISSKFKELSFEIEKKIEESSDWINFKNCCYNIETKDYIVDKEARRKYAFDTYIDANYLYDKIDLSCDEENDYDITDDMEYFLYFKDTSLNGNLDKLSQIGQHLVYSICTKTKQRKAKQVLLMLGEHDVGKSCILDLFMSYFPPKMIQNISPTKFGSEGSRAKVFNIRLNATHETSSERNLPVSEFNKTVWINTDQAVVNDRVYTGNYLQLHQVYGANQFFKAKEQYNPKDYLPKINLLLVDGKPKKKILDLSDKIVSEKDAIITFFLYYGLFKVNKDKYLSVYKKLKNDKFNFIELEDAIEFKNEIQAAYDEENLMRSQKKEKKIDTSVLDYGVDQFLKEKMDFYDFDDNFLEDIRSYSVEQAIKLISAKVPDKNRILFDDLYSCYANYCYEKDIEAYTSSMFKKRMNGILKGNLLIESKIKSGKEIINYTNQYKKIIENERQLVVYKKFKDKSTGENKIGYIGIKVLGDE